MEQSYINIIDEYVWNNLTSIIKTNVKKSNKTRGYNNIYKHLYSISTGYNITIKNIVKDYLTHLIKYKQIKLTPQFLLFVEKLVHTTDCTDESFINYALVNVDRFSDLL